MGRWLLRRLAEPSPADWLLAAILAVVAEIEIWAEPVFENGLPGPRGPLAAVVLLATLPLAWRRAWPLVVFAALMTAAALVALLADENLSGFELFIALLVAAYSAGAHSTGGRERIAGGVLASAGTLTFSLMTVAPGDRPVDVLVPVGLTCVAWAAGWEAHRLRQRAAGLAERVTRTEAEREEWARGVLQQERARIARELHDVVSHGISLMGIQAAAARSGLEPRQQEQREAMLTIERVGRESLSEMERMLDLLRGEASDAPDPQPTLAELRGLIDEARLAGTDVDLSVAGSPEPLPPSVELAAYRIVQEGLTNARKHAPGARVRVTLAYTERDVRVEIVDDGGVARPNAHSGHGLIGMRERVAMHHGEFEAGPVPGGWRTAAVLPIRRPT